MITEHADQITRLANNLVHCSGCRSDRTMRILYRYEDKSRCESIHIIQLLALTRRPIELAEEFSAFGENLGEIW